MPFLRQAVEEQNTDTDEGMTLAVPESLTY